MQGSRYRLAQKETNEAEQVAAHTYDSVCSEKMSHDDEQQHASETNAEHEKGESEVGRDRMRCTTERKERTKERESARMLPTHYSPVDMLRTALDEPTSLESVTVTEMEEKLAVGVPDRLPVAVSNARPVGKEEEIENRVAAGNP